MTSWIAASLQTLSNYFGNEEDEEEALKDDVLATTGSSQKKRKASITTTSSHSSDDTHEDDAESKTRSSDIAKRQKSGSVAPATAKLTKKKDGDPGSKALATKNADTTDQQQL